MLRKSIQTGLLGLMVFLLAHCATTRPPYAIESEIPYEAGTIRVLSCFKTEAPPVIDGKLDDACWTKAQAATGLFIYGSSEPAQEQTTARVLHDETNLYLALRLEESHQIQSEPRDRDSYDLFADDRINIFFDFDHEHDVFYQLAVNAAGSFFDARFHNGTQDPTWSLQDVKIKTHLQENAWILEMAIPFASVGQAPPEKGAVWGFNLMRRKPREDDEPTTEWTSTTPGWQDAATLGDLIFGGTNACLRKISPQFSDQALELQITRRQDTERDLAIVFETSTETGAKSVKTELYQPEQNKLVLTYKIPPLEGQRLFFKCTLKDTQTQEQLYQTVYHYVNPVFLTKLIDRANQLKSRARASTDPLVKLRGLDLDIRTDHVVGLCQQVQQNLRSNWDFSSLIHQLNQAEMVSELLTQGKTSDDTSLLNMTGDLTGQTIWETIAPSRDILIEIIGVYYAGIPLGAIRVTRYPATDTVKEELEKLREASKNAESNITSRSFNGQEVFIKKANGTFMAITWPEGKNIWNVLGYTEQLAQSLLKEAMNRDVITSRDIQDLVDQIPFSVEVEGLREILEFNYAGAAVVPITPSDTGLAAAIQKELGGQLISFDNIAGHDALVAVGPLQNMNQLGITITGLAPGQGFIKFYAQPDHKLICVSGSDDAGLDEAYQTLVALIKNFKGKQALVGDLHMHSFFSDGSSSPMTVIKSTIRNYMDFASLTDHNTINGVNEALEKAKELKLDYNIIRGQEITTYWAHMVAVGITKLIDWTAEPQAILDAVHEDNGIIILAHPGNSEWTQKTMAAGKDSGVDGFEARSATPDYYPQWKKTGKLPVMIASTDTHDTTYSSYLARTMVFAQENTPSAVVEAVKQGQCVAYAADERIKLCGPDSLIRVFNALLNEGQYLREEHLKRLVKRAASLN